MVRELINWESADMQYTQLYCNTTMAHAPTHKFIHKRKKKTKQEQFVLKKPQPYISFKIVSYYRHQHK